MKPPVVHLRQAGRLFEARVHMGITLARVGGGYRGRVSGFSRQSRRRLLKKLAALRDEQAVFLTLTYGQRWPSEGVCKRDLLVFIKRVRRAYPGAAGFWRVELQERGAPHFHLLLFGVPVPESAKAAQEQDGSVWRPMWGGVVDRSFWDTSQGPGRERAPITATYRCLNTRQVTCYVAKYVAKVEGVPVAQPVSGEAGQPAAAAPYLDKGTYQAAAMPELGRIWGTFNVLGLPWAVVREVSAQYGRWFARFCGHLGYFGRLPRRYVGSHFVFCDRYDGLWLRRALDFLGDSVCVLTMKEVAV